MVNKIMSWSLSVNKAVDGVGCLSVHFRNFSWANLGGIDVCTFLRSGCSRALVAARAPEASYGLTLSPLPHNRHRPHLGALAKIWILYLMKSIGLEVQTSAGWLLQKGQGLPWFPKLAITKFRLIGDYRDSIGDMGNYCK